MHCLVNLRFLRFFFFFFRFCVSDVAVAVVVTEAKDVMTVVAGGLMMSGLGVIAALLINSRRR